MRLAVQVEVLLQQFAHFRIVDGRRTEGIDPRRRAAIAAAENAASAAVAASSTAAEIATTLRTVTLTWTRWTVPVAWPRRANFCRRWRRRAIVAALGTRRRWAIVPRRLLAAGR